MKSLWTILRRALPTSALLLILAFGATAIAHAAGGATFRDDAALFTTRGRNSINSAAQDANIRVVVITNNQRFTTRADWESWLRAQATDSGAITIGLHAVRGQQKIYAVPGSQTHISQSQATQAVNNAIPTFNSSGVTAGVVDLINQFKAQGAVAPGGAGSGNDFGWVIPLVVLAVLAYLVLRVLGGRRRYAPGPGYGQFGSTYQGPGPGFGGGGGGGFGRGFLGGALGGLGGAWLGNQLFGNRGGGDVNASGYDPNAGPTDTANAQSMQGGWGGDGGNASGGGDTGNAGGGWSGDPGGGGDWSGGGDAGGGGGWDSGGSNDSGGGWT